MKSLMIQGTTSSAGKSTIVTALCRIFVQKGIDVFPFKAQNMSRNYMHTNTGKRISSAQFVQAHAARIEPSELMNPVLLVPETDVGSEAVSYTHLDVYKRQPSITPSKFPIIAKSKTIPLNN